MYCLLETLTVFNPTYKSVCRPTLVEIDISFNTTSKCYVLALSSSDNVSQKIYQDFDSIAPGISVKSRDRAH